MKSLIATILAIALLVTLAGVALADEPETCNKIKDGTIVDSNGDPLVLGYDQYGYNYQAHMFNGRYCDYDRVSGGDYCDVGLIMKWNDAWLSNKDCDGDGLLDRYYGFESYIGSGAWLTNHQWGSYEGEDGKIHKWDYFVKIIAVPSDAYLDGGIWYTADDVEIGPAIWGAFAVIQEVSNDPYAGEHGVLYNAPAPAGFGYYMP